MLVTINKLNLEFNEDVENMQKQLQELERLEQKIEESAHFELLAGKTQMLGKGKGVTKKERSRMIHTNTIAYDIVEKTIKKIYDKVLKYNPVLNSNEYREIFQLNKKIAIRRGMIMAKAHDIGHVAKGHEGEKAINDFMSEIKDADEIQAVLDEHEKYFGIEYEQNQGHITDAANFSLSFVPNLQSLSFEHNELGAILLNKIIEKENIKLSPEEVKKLTLGVLGHSTSRTPIKLLEGDLIAQIVRVADKVEYVNADYDEIASLLKIDANLESELISYLQKTLPERINQTTGDLADEAFRIGEINENHATMRRISRMRKIYDDIISLYDGNYANEILENLIKKSNNQDDLHAYYAENIGVEALYSRKVIDTFKADVDILKNASKIDPIEVDDAYQRILTEQVHFKSVMEGENSDRIYFIYQRVLEYYYSHPELIPETVRKTIIPIDLKQSKTFEYTLDPNYSKLQKLLEYISLLDDEALMRTYEDLVEERIEKGPGFGVEPITMSEIKGYLRQMFDKEAQKLVVKENIGTRTYEEARALCSKKSREYFRNKLTVEGENAMKKFYSQRFKEYNEDFVYLQRMLKADEERQNKIVKEEQGMGEIKQFYKKEPRTYDE